jgi:hypothetical protein
MDNQYTLEEYLHIENPFKNNYIDIIKLDILFNDLQNTNKNIKYDSINHRTTLNNFKNNNNNNNTNEQIEYWMNTEHFKSCIVLCNNTFECSTKLDYFSQHIIEAFNVAKKGYEYTVEILKPENVDKYWQKLLTSYNTKVKNYNNILVFNNKY